MGYKLGLFGLMIVFILSSVFAAPWDFLREPVQGVAVIEPVIVWFLLVVSAVLACISIIAWKKKHSQKLAFVAAAFVLFFMKSLLLILDLFLSSGNFFNYSVQSLFDLVIVACLFVALFGK